MKKRLSRPRAVILPIADFHHLRKTSRTKFCEAKIPVGGWTFTETKDGFGDRIPRLIIQVYFLESDRYEYVSCEDGRLTERMIMTRSQAEEWYPDATYPGVDVASLIRERIAALEAA